MRFGWGGGALQRTGGLRPQPGEGGFGGTKRVAEGAAGPMAELAAHSQCMQGPPFDWRVQRRKAEPPTQAVAVGAAETGEQPWQRTTVVPGPEE